MSASSQEMPPAPALASDSALQLALVSCACELVSFLFARPQQLFPAACKLIGSTEYMLEMWQAVQLYIKFGRMSAQEDTPSAVLHYFAYMRMRILDELAFAHSSTVFDAMLSDPIKNSRLHLQVCDSCQAALTHLCEACYALLREGHDCLSSHC